MQELEIEVKYKNDAKNFVDSMFDAKIFNEKVTRDDMQGYEDLLAFTIQSNANSVKKIFRFTESLKHLK